MKKALALPAVIIFFATILGWFDVKAQTSLSDELVFLEVSKFVAEDAFRNFGTSVSVDGDIALVGTLQDNNYDDAVYVFERVDGQWIQQQKLSQAEVRSFGGALSLQGDTAMIGAVDQAVYVYKNQDGIWVQNQKLTASDGGGIYPDRFGRSVSLDGDRVLIGGGRESQAGVYIFELENGFWIEKKKLMTPVNDVFPHTGFGNGLSLDGDTALIGAPWDYQSGVLGGSAYVYVFNGIDWVLQQQLSPPDPEPDKSFGASVSLDGDVALIGAPHGNDRTSDIGSAYIYVRDGEEWSLVQQLYASDRTPENNNGVHQYFGDEVLLSGGAAVIGAFNANGRRGATYVFNYYDGFWSETQKLAASDGSIGDYFGRAMALSGNTLLIAADNDNRKGSVYHFEASSSTFSLPGKLEAENFDEGENGETYYDVTAGNTGGLYRDRDVDIDVASEGGYCVRWITEDEWLLYTVDVKEAGYYDILGRVSSVSVKDKAFHVEINGVDVTGLMLFNTGGAGTGVWQDVEVFDVWLEAGIQKLKIYMDIGGFNLNHLDVQKSSVARVPGRIEAEDFSEGLSGETYYDLTAGNIGDQYRDTDVDIARSSEGGYRVAWITAGEWLTYDIGVREAGYYDFIGRISSESAKDKAFHVEINGADVTGLMTFNTGGSGQKAWQDVEALGIWVNAGTQELTIFMDRGGFNLDYLDIVKSLDVVSHEQ